MTKSIPFSRLASHPLKTVILAPLTAALLWAGCSSGPVRQTISKKSTANADYSTQQTDETETNSGTDGTASDTPVVTAPNQDSIPGTTTGTTNTTPGTDSLPAIGSTDAAGWKLIWSDEFEAATIDSTKWNFEILNPGTYNNELQGYTDRPENARVEKGHLVIEARKDNYKGQAYTSARMNSKGKGFWKYGRIEARIQLTSALGTWPAFWMMPEDQSKGWPACGEIDIMEEVGFDKDVVHGTTHTRAFFGENGRGASKTLSNLSADYHVYAIEWYADHIDWFVDGAKYFTQKNDTNSDDTYPFNKPFHVILNFAIGGAWGGAKGVVENMPNQQMLVDYVRVYQK